MMEYLHSILVMIWDMFAIPWPGVGISCGRVVLGIFVVGFSIGLARGLLSLISTASGGVTRAARGAVQRGKHNKSGYYSHKGKESKKDG